MPIFEGLNDANLAIEVNNDYDIENSLTKAKLLRQAVRYLLIHRAASMSKTGGTSEEARFDQQVLLRMYEQVEKWIGDHAANSSRGRWRQFTTKCQTR